MINKLKYLFKKRKEKKRKGFTLVELLAVIVILAVIMVITIPTVLGNMKEARQQTFNTVGETMIKYLKDNYNNCKLGNKDIAKYDKDLFDDECSLNNINMQKLIEKSGYNTNDIEKVDVTNDGRGNYGVYIYPEDDGEFSGVKKQLTNSVPNKPDLTTGLVPIKYDGTNWVVTTSTDSEWFDYSNQKWANAASLKDGVSKEPGTLLIVPDGEGITEADSDIYAMFVWIPRFSYTKGCYDGVPTNVEHSFRCVGYKVNGASNLSYQTGSSSSPGAIDIKFVSTNVTDDPGINFNKFPMYSYTTGENGLPTKDRVPDNWYTHPAFWWDEDNNGKRKEDGSEELSGIWVGKFETSVNSNSNCYTSLSNKQKSYDYCIPDNNSDATPRILPNVLSLTNLPLVHQFNMANKFSTENNKYGIDNTKTDGHMMKNIEWAAVAYLSQSIYGKYGNTDYSVLNKEIYVNNSGRASEWAGYTGRSKGEVPKKVISEDANNLFSLEGNYKYDDTAILDGSKEKNAGTGASTTGNIYGIYDMSGGAYERVMGVYTYGYTGWKPEEKYFDNYCKNSSGCNLKGIISSETVGTATAETKRWYDNDMTGLNSGNWLIRGGKFNTIDMIGGKNTVIIGIFSNYTVINATSSFVSFRTVLVNK